MIRDPWLEWNGQFPYDALGAAGVTLESTMREILDAQYTLVDLHLFNTEIRSIWNDMRKPEERLWVDLFLYPISLDEILAALDQIGEPTGGARENISGSRTTEDPSHG